MADIFISYARQDRDNVERLVHALKEAGWSVFWDPSIVPGVQWDNLIEAELKAAKCVMVVWTPQSVSREWVRIEAHHGRSTGNLLPVVLEPCEIPITFAHIQAEDLTAGVYSPENEGFARLLGGLTRIAGEPAPTVVETQKTVKSDGQTDFFSKVFDDLFNESGPNAAGAPQAQESRGADLRYNLEITLEEAFTGKTVAIQIPKESTGSEADRRLSVRVPPGVEDGTRIRLAGEGERKPDGVPPGDLYVLIAIKPHELLRAEGADLFVRAPISMGAAIQGGELHLAMIDGSRIRVKTPAGARSGKQLRLRGMGMKRLNSEERGDFYVQLEVETPKNLTAAQVRMIEALEAEASDQTYPETAEFRRKNGG